MNKNMNKKGMTLVEVIVAMSVFAVIFTGFVMSAKYAYGAQVKAKKRLSQSNTQTMNLEDYRGIVDPTYKGTYGTSGDTDLGVKSMADGDNRWTMTYNFGGSAVITNDRVYGYYATPDMDDEVFELAYFSPSDVVALEPGEYWITITNVSNNDLPMAVVCGSGFQLFNNEKKVFPAKTSMPERIIPKDGYKISFGVKDMSYEYRNTGGAVQITNPMAEYTGGGAVLVTINPSDVDDNETHYVEVYYTNTGFTFTAP